MRVVGESGAKRGAKFLFTLRPMAEVKPGVGRRGHGEDAIYFDASKKRYVGAVSLGHGSDGRRVRRKVVGRTKARVRDKLKALHLEWTVPRLRSFGVATSPLGPPHEHGHVVIEPRGRLGRKGSGGRLPIPRGRRRVNVTGGGRTVPPRRRPGADSPAWGER